MSKKAKKKPAPKPKAATKGKAAKAAAPKAKRQVLAQDSLPGMEQVRHPELARSCAAIGEIRDTKNAAIQEELAERNHALQIMRRDGYTSYHEHGIELLRVAGDEELRVKKYKDRVNADAIAASGDDDDADGEE